MIYKPEEDSYFLRNFVEKLDLEGEKFLEVGAGTGITARTAFDNGANVTASDISKEAVEYLKQNLPQDIEVVRSNLFENINSKFGVIVFNPPYLSGERTGEDDPLVGGEKGVEITREFLENCANYLRDEGVVYVIVSSESDYQTLIDDFDLEAIDERKLWFETLYLLKTG